MMSLFVYHRFSLSFTFLLFHFIAHSIANSCVSSNVLPEEDHLSVEESQKNYMKQYPFPQSQSTNSYYRLPIGPAYEHEQNSLVAELDPKYSSYDELKEVDDLTSNQSSLSNNDEDDSHYAPKYNEPNNIIDKGSTQSGGNFKKNHYVPAYDHLQDAQRMSPNSKFQLSGSPKQHGGRPTDEPMCVCQCPDDQPGKKLSHRRSFLHPEGTIDDTVSGGNNNFFPDVMNNQAQGGAGGDQSVASSIQKDISCHFAVTQCGWVNDYYKDSLFRYDYNPHFGSSMWYIDRQPNGPHKPPPSKGWGRVISPYYEKPASQQHNHDACMLIEFEFDSEGTDQMIVLVQEEDNTRSILDYMHERPAEKEALLLRKFVHFVVTGQSIRFFVQFRFQTQIPESQYGLRTFELTFNKCPQNNAYNLPEKNSNHKTGYKY